MSKTDNYGWTDEDPESSYYLNTAVLKVIRARGARTVLDVGCGNGALAAFLSRAGFEVTGVDGDETGIAIAQKKYPDIRFRVDLFQNQPSETYDLVCSTEVVEHLYSPHELAGYCFRSLKPGGVLVISTPYHGYLKNLVLSVLDKWDTHFTVNWHGGHIKFWSRKTLTTLLEKNGFVVDGFVGAGRFPYLWKSMILTATRP